MTEIVVFSNTFKKIILKDLHFSKSLDLELIDLDTFFKDQMGPGILSVTSVRGVSGEEVS